MRLELQRTLYPGYTEGRLIIDSRYFCDTLEPQARDLNGNGVFDGDEHKLAGQTAIPASLYEIIVSYSPKFKRDLPLLLDVPEFSGIRIHSGNTAKDSAGCILVGHKDKDGHIRDSRKTEAELVSMMEAAIQRREMILINITQ